MVIKMHYSVLKNELLENLDIKDGGIYIDGTIGYAGDSKEILKKYQMEPFMVLMLIKKR